MASCSLGASNVKVVNLDYGRQRFGSIQQYGTKCWTSRRSMKYARLVMSQQSNKSVTVCSDSKLETQSVARSENGSEETLSSGLTSELIPKINEVEFLLKKLCETSSIAELEIKLPGFHLHVVRDSSAQIRNSPPPPAVPASVSVNTAAEAPDLNGSVSTSLADSKPVSSSAGIQRLLDKATDEGLVIIQSPGVGFFRRSRTIKGKRAPPLCKEKQTVKEGQVVCYIEQLGGQKPIESDVSGEVVKILRKDGDPIGYRDALIAVLPSFPGIKKLQ